MTSNDAATSATPHPAGVAIAIDAKPPPALSAARWAVTAIFFINGVVFSSWVPRIPAIREKLDLGEAELGLALLGAAVGAMISLAFVGGPISRFGSRPVTIVGVMGLSAMMPLPALAPSGVWLGLALVVVGVFVGGLDAAMNAHGVAVERRYGRPILSSFHAAFSFGGLAGALLGGLAARAGLEPTPHLIVVAVMGVVASAVASRGLFPASVDAVMRPRDSTKPAERSALRHPSRALLLLGLLGFCCLVGEGAMADWSAVYLEDSLDTGPGLAAVGYAAFSLTMAIGRLFGDRLTAAWGPVAITQRGGTLVAVGLGLALVLDQPLAAILGFAAVGAGLSAVVPVVFSAAGRTPGFAPGPAIAAVSVLGYGGFLVGPPMIGFAAALSSLPIALGLVAVMGALVALLAGAVAPIPSKR